MELAPDLAAFWLVVGLGATLALRARSLGLRTSMVRVGASLTLPVLLPFLRPLLPAGAARVTITLLCWGSMLALALSAAHVASRAAAQLEPPLARRARNLSLGLRALAIFEAVLALTGADSEMAQLVVLALGVCVSALIVTVAAIKLARVHVASAALDYARLGHILATLSAATIVGPVLALLGICPKWFALLAVVTFPISTPLLTWRLVGPGPVSYDVTSSPTLEPPRSWAPVVVPLVGVLASLLIVQGYLRHFRRCGGELVPAPAPARWNDLPLLAEGSTQDIGPFKFRANHFSYKGYPAAYENAALSDPSLCFYSTISLESWFVDMYRSPAELRLRLDTASDVFAVSGIQAESGEKLIAAFRRHRAPRLAFDSAVSRGFLLGESLLFALGLSALVAWPLLIRAQKSERARQTRTLAGVLFAASIAMGLSFEERWSGNDVQKPGRELATEYPWIM
ncbi:MAG: hypothetical protein ACOY0T_00295 [Myxococcota bacterium]